MCRLLGWVAQSPLTLRDVLGEESFVAFASLSRIHADGWGVAYADGDGHGNGRVQLERSITCALTDPAFQETASRVAAPAGLAHLRWASPGLPVELRNAHPFRHGDTAFAHNGGIYPFERLTELLDDEWRAQLTGTTDSEHYFLAVLAEMRAGGVDAPTAIERVAGRLAREFTPSSLNAMLLTPEALYVINCHDESIRPVVPPGRDPDSIDRMVEAAEQQAPYYDLRYRRGDSCVVVASSGFAQPEGGGWRAVSKNAVLVVDRATLEITEVPLDVRIQPSETTTGAGSELR
jgi:predicted glutamine amidotransferase